MSRRRKKNPLLTRILVVSLVVHAIALPIAAHYGAFERIRQEFGTSKVVMVTVPPLEEPKKQPEKAQRKPTKTSKGSPKKAPGEAHKANVAAPKSNLSQPKVVAASGEGGGDGGGPAVDPNGSGKAGELPTEIKPGGGTGTGGTGAGGNEAPKNPDPKPTEPVAPPKTEPKPTEPVKTTPPAETKPEPPKPARFVQAQESFTPEPAIPDELRTEPFEKTLVVEADVDTEGKPTNVRISSGTGTKQLDDIGLDTAKRYRFRPATMNDQPVAQHVRFRIIFKVEG